MAGEMFIALRARADRTLEVGVNSECGMRNAELSRSPNARLNSEFRIPNSALYAGQQGDHLGTVFAVEWDPCYAGMICRLEAESSAGKKSFDIGGGRFALPREMTESGGLTVQLVFTVPDGSPVVITARC